MEIIIKGKKYTRNTDFKRDYKKTLILWKQLFILLSH
jgi:hypothetical protein